MATSQLTEGAPLSVTCDFTGRTAFVTDGSAGWARPPFGLRAARAHVAIADVDVNALRNLADELTAQGPSALGSDAMKDQASCR